MGLVNQNKKTPKSLIDVCILDILRDTDKKNTVTQKRICNLLKDRYGIKADRKTLHRHLEAMVESIDGIQFTEVQRIVDGKHSGIMTDFWLSKKTPFDDMEIRALIYTVLFSKHIPVIYKKDIIKKLETLPSNCAHREMRNYVFEDENTINDFNELFLNMEIIGEAIDEKRQVSFKYAKYEIDRELHVSDKIFHVSPLGIGVSDGDFFLVATVNAIENDHPTDMQTHFEEVVEAVRSGEVRIDVFRMDRICDAEKLDESSERLCSSGELQLKGIHRGRLNVQEYARENPSLSSGHAVQARLRLIEGERCTISDVIDHFGKANVRISVDGKSKQEGSQVYVISVKVNDGALRDFVLRNTPDIELIKPTELREEIESCYRTALERMHAK